MQLRGMAALVVSLLAVPGAAHADPASGTWTGAAELRGNYYWERSTRVVAPALNLELSSPSGVRLHGDYLVDTITSASQAAGAIIDVRFREIRHDVGGGLGYELDLGGAQLDLGLSSRYSHEPDYRSLSGTLTSALSLNDRATVLRLSLTLLRDDVGKILRGMDRTGPMGRDLSDRGQQGELHSTVLSLSVEQLLSPVVTAQVGYDLGVLHGLLSSPYRQGSVEGVLSDETHPDRRVRHTLFGRLALYSRPTHTAFHLMYRAYMDSWDIAAISPEVRIYQEIGPFTVLRLRHRYYTQTRAFFYRPVDQYTEPAEYFTADPKMSEFHSHLLGVQIRLGFGFLDDSALAFLREASFDLSFDYIWNTNRYGNGVISQVGLRVPF